MTEYTESVDLKACAYLLHRLKNKSDDMVLQINENQKVINKADISKIIKYCEFIYKNKGEKITKYTYVNKRTDGRLFAINGIQSFPKDLRGLLCRDKTTDIDIVNCHPVILLQICNDNNIIAPQLTYYVKNRDNVLNDIMDADNIDRDEAKTKILKSTNSNFIIKTKSAFLKQYDKEIKDIQKKLQDIKEYEYIKAYASHQINNFDGSFLNHILCVYENNILQQMIEFIKHKNIKIHSLMFDGLMIYGNYYDNNNLLTEMEQYIRRKYTWNIQIAYKQHSTLFTIPDDFTGDPYQEMKEDFEKNNCKVGCEFVHFTAEKVDVYKKKDFTILHEHKYRLNDDDFTSKWYIDKDMKCYIRFEVFPNEDECPKDVYNLWRAFPAKHHMYSADSNNICEKGLNWFLNHIKVVLCSNNETYYKFVCMWLAQMFQYPHIKSIMLAFISEPGAGKGVFIEYIKTIIGLHNLLETTDAQNDVFGAFNSNLKDCFLVCFNEANKSNFYNANDKLKALITDPTLNIRIKNVTSFTIKSFHRFMLFTNNPDPFNATKDRRHFISRCSDEKIDDDEYFNEGFSYCHHMDVAKAIYDYFMQYPTKQKITKNDIPITEYHRQLMESNKPHIELFLEELLSNDVDRKTPYVISNNDIFKEFKTFCSNSNISNTMTPHQFLLRLHNSKISGIEKKMIWKNNTNVRGCLFDVDKVKESLGILDVPKHECYIDIDDIDFP